MFDPNHSSTPCPSPELVEGSQYNPLPTAATLRVALRTAHILAVDILPLCPVAAAMGQHNGADHGNEQDQTGAFKQEDIFAVEQVPDSLEYSARCCDTVAGLASGMPSLTAPA